MPSQNFLPLLLTVLLGAAFLVRERRTHSARKSAFEDRLLWMGLAAGLFDSDDCPATSRLEIALAAIARKLGLRAGIVVTHGRTDSTVLATAGVDASLLRGLERGARVPSATLYSDTLLARGQSLAIDYAALSEWRRHPAYEERGWESYIGVNCGLEEGEDLVVSFFDSRPRTVPFSRAERQLVEQVAPWVAAMVGERAGTGAPELPVPEAPGPGGEIPVPRI
jgi:hypothetical protein